MIAYPFVKRVTRNGAEGQKPSIPAERGHSYKAASLNVSRLTTRFPSAIYTACIAKARAVHLRRRKKRGSGALLPAYAAHGRRTSSKNLPYLCMINH